MESVKVFKTGDNTNTDIKTNKQLLRSSSPTAIQENKVSNPQLQLVLITRAKTKDWISFQLQISFSPQLSHELWHFNQVWVSIIILFIIGIIYKVQRKQMRALSLKFIVNYKSGDIFLGNVFISYLLSDQQSHRY